MRICLVRRGLRLVSRSAFALVRLTWPAVALSRSFRVISMIFPISVLVAAEMISDYLSVLCHHTHPVVHISLYSSNDSKWKLP